MKKKSSIMLFLVSIENFKKIISYIFEKVSFLSIISNTYENEDKEYLKKENQLRY